MFIPTTKQELDQLGWDTLDIILVTGDSYVDSPFVGVSVVGRVMIEAGYRVGIIAQPDVQSRDDITRLGEPALFWGVTGGCIDSMVANYTATKKPKRSDDLTPDGRNDRRPDRAAIAYTNLIKRHFKGTVPIVLGGVEVSLRRDIMGIRAPILDAVTGSTLDEVEQFRRILLRPGHFTAQGLQFRFETNLNHEYQVLVDHFDFDAGELERISLNGLHASLLPPAGKARLEDEFRAQFAQLRAELSA